MSAPAVAAREGKTQGCGLARLTMTVVSVAYGAFCRHCACLQPRLSTVARSFRARSEVAGPDPAPHQGG